MEPIEWIDVYDKNRTRIGKVIQRYDPLGAGEFRLVVHVCLFNAKDELLIQQRQPWKKLFPGYWDVSAAGCALRGETSAQAGERETLEELGCRIDLSQERPFFTFYFERGFDDFYLIEKEVDLAALTLQATEVQAVQWASREKVMRMAREGLFVNYCFLSQLFDLCKNRSAYLSL